MAAWHSLLRTPRRSWNQVRGLWPYLAPSRKNLLAVVLIAAPVGVLEASVLMAIAEIALVLSRGAERLTFQVAGASVDMPLVWGLALAGLLALLRLFLVAVTAYLPARIVSDVQALLRLDISRAYLEGTYASQERNPEGHLQEVILSHVDRVGALTLALISGARALAMGSVLLIAAITIHPTAAVALAGVAGVLGVIMRPLAVVVRRASAEHTRASMSLAGEVSQMARLAKDHNIFGTGEHYSTVIANHIFGLRGPYRRTHFAASAIGEGFQALVLTFLLSGLAIVYATGTAALSSLGAAVLVLLRGLAYAQQLQVSYAAVNDHLPYIGNCIETVRTLRSHAASPGDCSIAGTAPYLVMRGVSYTLPTGTDVITELDLDLKPGHTALVTGPSGSGKTTLSELLLRLRSPTSGEYRVNGIDAARIKRQAWARMVAHVPQSPQLLSGTIMENIRFYRPDVTDEAIVLAAKRANIHDEVLARPGGYQAVVRHVGDTLSGGQKQRLALARALAGCPGLLILDEPTSALDDRSAALVTKTLISLRRAGVSLVVVSHRTIDVPIDVHVDLTQRPHSRRP